MQINFFYALLKSHFFLMLKGQYSVERRGCTYPTTSVPDTAPQARSRSSVFLKDKLYLIM